MDLKKKTLEYHQRSPSGKISMMATKPLETQEDLSMAYSPGVAIPCLEILKNKDLVYSYTNKGNLVAIISNGSAVLGLGNIGPIASKPVMEGKAVLFKKFAGIDSIDIEVDHKDPKSMIETIKAVSNSFGGINLEDIKAPECFEVERKLIELLDIPVMHDDQHGTAIVVAAGLHNSLEIVNKDFESIKLVICGAGAAGIACAKLLVSLGVQKKHLTLLDSRGVINTEREELPAYKREFAANTKASTLKEAIEGTDVFIGLSKADILNVEQIKLMNKSPIVFALANPNPEIEYEKAINAQKDIIVATGRSDYPNQLNNVLCFPYIFRGALQVKAKCINQEMKLAAVKAIADLAKKKVTSEVKMAYRGKGETFSFGRNYIVPKPLDARLLKKVSNAVAEAAKNSGVARN